MSFPTTGTYWNQTSPAPDSGMQPAVIKSDNATPQDSRTISVPSTGGVLPKTASYTAVAADCGRLLSFNSASAVTYTLPATPPSVGTNQWEVAVESIGAGALTVAATSGAKLDGVVGGSLALAQNTGCRIFTDGTDYYTQRGASASGITQLTGDVTAGPGSGSVAASVVKVNGATVPASKSFVGTNASGQIVAATLIRKVVLVVDGGSSVPATGAVNRFIQLDFAGTIVGWAAFGAPSGSVSVDVWKKAGTAPPTATAPVLPTSTDKISASAPVAISAAQSAAGGASAVSTWTTAVVAGDTFGFSVASVATFTAFTVELYIQQS